MIIHEVSLVIEVRDRNDRKTNLVVQGIAEGESQAGLAVKMASMLRPPSGSVVEAFRLGSPRVGASRPRPVLVRFNTVQAKHTALKTSKELRVKKVYLDADLTERQQEIRRQKGQRYRELRDKKARPFWREERLFYYSGDRVVEDKGVLPGPPRPPPTASTEQSNQAGPSHMGQTPGV